MKISQEIIDKIQPLNQASFQKIKDTEFRPSYDLMGLKYLRDKSGNERNLRELYRSRAPYELLQNADDVGAKTVAFILSSDGIAFVHDGTWFTLDNFRSLADGWSDKDPNECIGHKGLGFRSVLDITPSPYLIRVDSKSFFSVKFTWALNNGHIQEAFKKNSTLRKQYEKWTKHGQIACPVMAIPGIAKKHNLGLGADIYNDIIRGMFGGPYTTMFWLPATDADIEQRALDELSPTPIVANQKGRSGLLKFFDKEVRVLLPFLSSIEQVKLFYHSQLLGSIEVPPKTKETNKAREITVRSFINEQTYTETFYQLSFDIAIPPNVRNDPETPKAVKSLKKASITLSLCIEDGQPIRNLQSSFHIYFPTDEPTGVGFIVHGDFYVMPDRTRLMGGAYNEWLLNEAAQKTANEFLTALLKEYKPEPVFKALSPISSNLTNSGALFVSKLSIGLKGRQKPFIPSKYKLLMRDEVVLPPEIDKDGFWDDHFAEVVGSIRKEKVAFMDPEIDNRETRAFLKLAGISPIDRNLLIDYIGKASEKLKDSQWWYECYEYIAKDEKLSQKDQSYFIGRKLIPLDDGSAIQIPDEKGTMLCLPPRGGLSSLKQPEIFKGLFLFLNGELAERLADGEDVVFNWVSHRFRISKFEASDIIPRAVRNISPKIFNGELIITFRKILDVWLFIFKVIQISRPIISTEFWHDAGRFPVPVSPVSNDNHIKPERLTPAFLCYFPDSVGFNKNCILEVNGFRHASGRFLSEFIKNAASTRESCLEFFNNAGISYELKILHYRMIVGAKGITVSPSGFLQKIQNEFFSGEYQRDTNVAVKEIINEHDLLGKTISNAEFCEHETEKEIQKLVLIDGIRRCANKAQDEFKNGDDNWRKRLKSIAESLSSLDIHEHTADSLFCRGGSISGHSIPFKSYLAEQLDSYKWLPTSVGPASRNECFLRLSTRRLISKGITNEDLGDKIIPYVVVEEVDEYSKLKNIGVEPLEDPDSCSSKTLIRALLIIGEKLSSNWGKQEIVSVRSRWRLVRGAIQEIYRILNSRDDYDFPKGLKLAVRIEDGYQFESLPLYYADPGSSVEKAFHRKLLLVDTDRPYPKFFDKVGITRLKVGKNVDVTFMSEETSNSAHRLKTEIMDKLSRYLLSPIIAKSEKTKHADLVLRRLKDRFSVDSSDQIRVLFTISGSQTSQQIEFPKFYLDKRTTQSKGAVEENHYKLYFKGKKKNAIADLDADALGEVLSPIFFDGMNDDSKEIFPRITNRYQSVNGDPIEMREYLFTQLGVSKEAQEIAVLMVTGKYEKVTEPTIPPPPPITIVDSVHRKSLNDNQGFKEKISGHRSAIQQKTVSFIRKIEEAADENESGLQEATTRKDTNGLDQQYEITREQRDRGKTGEEEFKRRLMLPGGWEGFSLVKDKRLDGCGYDFLCNRNDREVKVEVKTFIENGRIIFTSRELHESAISNKDYYLIGILDNATPQYEWPAYVVQNPIHVLIQSGEFDIQAKLQAAATSIFQFKK